MALRHGTIIDDSSEPVSMVDGDPVGIRALSTRFARWRSSRESATDGVPLGRREAEAAGGRASRSSCTSRKPLWSPCHSRESGEPTQRSRRQRAGVTNSLRLPSDRALQPCVVARAPQRLRRARARAHTVAGYVPNSMASTTHFSTASSACGRRRPPCAVRHRASARCVARSRPTCCSVQRRQARRVARLTLH